VAWVPNEGRPGSPALVRVSLQVMEETRLIPDVIDAVARPSGALDDLLASGDASKA
jgi:acetyl-CoA C-acetyltransferase